MDDEFVIDEDLVDFYEASVDPLEVFDQKRYLEEELIGEGAFKQVYRVKDVTCNRDVALARIKTGCEGKRAILDFIREVQLAASLEHPNIARIYDFGHDGSVPYFTMELIHGVTLDQWVQTEDKDFSGFRKLDLFLELCSAVTFAHSKNVLHLDLKPQNIHLSEHGRVLLADWGISSYLASSSLDDELLGSRNLKGFKAGTPGFSSPERLVGKEPNVASDIYSCLLYTSPSPRDA